MQNDPFNPNQAPQDQPVVPPQPVQQPQAPPAPAPAPAQQFAPEQSAQPVQQFAQNVPQQPQPMQAASQQQVQPVQPKRSKKGLIIGLLAGVVVLLITATVIYFVFMRDGDIGTATKNQSTAGGSSSEVAGSDDATGSGSTAGGSGNGSNSPYGVDTIQSMVSKAYGVTSSKVVAASGDASRVIVTVEVEESPISATSLRAIATAILNGSYGVFETATIDIVKGGAPNTAADLGTAMTRMQGNGALIGTPTASSVTFDITKLRDTLS